MSFMSNQHFYISDKQSTSRNGFYQSELQQFSTTEQLPHLATEQHATTCARQPRKYSYICSIQHCCACPRPVTTMTTHAPNNMARVYNLIITFTRILISRLSATMFKMSTKITPTMYKITTNMETTIKAISTHNMAISFHNMLISISTIKPTVIITHNKTTESIIRGNNIMCRITRSKMIIQWLRTFQKKTFFN